jgi:hypothetical protein
MHMTVNLKEAFLISGHQLSGKLLQNLSVGSMPDLCFIIGYSLQTTCSRGIGLVIKLVLFAFALLKPLTFACSMQLH